MIVDGAKGQRYFREKGGKGKFSVPTHSVVETVTVNLAETVALLGRRSMSTPSSIVGIELSKLKRVRVAPDSVQSE